MIHIIGCAQGIISLHLVSTTWWVAPSISRWVWYCNHKHMSWLGWELVSTADLLQLGVVAPSVTRLTLWWNHKRWLIVLHDKMTMAMRGCYQWQCMEVMNQSNWSPTWAEARLKQIPLEISELFLKQNLIHVQCFKNRWFHFSIYSPPLVVITLSNIWSLHWIV